MTEQNELCVGENKFFETVSGRRREKMCVCVGRSN